MSVAYPDGCACNNRELAIATTVRRTQTAHVSSHNVPGHMPHVGGVYSRWMRKRTAAVVGDRAVSAAQG